MAEERLSASQRSKVRRLSSPRELAPDEEGGELNIVPFLDIIMNVLMFVRPPTTPTLGLTILVVGEGFSVKARGGNVAPGCADTGQGLAVGKTPDGKEYNFDALKKCVAGLKASSPDFADESSVTISANPNIPYQVVIG